MNDLKLTLIPVLSYQHIPNKISKIDDYQKGNSRFDYFKNHIWPTQNHQ